MKSFTSKTTKGYFGAKNKDNNQKHATKKNVFVNFAHGSRGLGTAILGAKF